MGAATGLQASDLLPMIEVSTEALPPEQQFEAFCDTQGGIVDRVPGPLARAGFATRQRTWHIGRIAVQHGRAPGLEWVRTPQRLRRDALDHWLLLVHPHTVTRARLGDASVVIPAGVPFIVAMHEPVEFVRPGGDWVSMFLPRDAFPDIAGVLDAARGRPMLGTSARLLGATAAMLTTELETMPRSEALALAAACRGLIAAAAAMAAGTTPLLASGTSVLRLAQLRRVIEENLGSARLDAEWLCRTQAISRATLYRLFEPFGGVAAYILEARMRKAHRSLAARDDIRSIAEIAISVGFFDAGAFARAFRRRFGCTPREFRVDALTALICAPEPMRGATAAPPSLTRLLVQL
ncbi:helix-turn-helix domain-containing protein [Falsiroseomonas oryzae]|uniref:helix-turn-helix domain-containing protein n=1 Tax=Falsiroseomonas oryzae TaxID=2766473 RepID=UPI0022EA3984|nr:helix-turn-helix domain-containing protein [Roseomonas sp. MO-31]